MNAASKQAAQSSSSTPPTATGSNTVDKVVDLTDTVAAIVKEVAEVLQHAPYVKTLTGVVLQFIKIRNELKINKERCKEIIGKVLNLSHWIYEKLAAIAKSGEKMKENLAQIENSLKLCASALKDIADELERHQTRSKLSKFIGRGLDDLNKLDRGVDNLEKQLVRDIVFDIKFQQGIPASVENKDPASSNASSGGHDHVLPPRPHLMVEREGQLDMALTILLSEEPSRIAILGGGGFGKTTLARSILHDQKITKRYRSRYFLSCEGMADVDALLLGFGTMLGITATPSAVLAAARRTLATSATLLCLDNFETPWEPSATRTIMEDVLASIADIPNSSLIITMRGTQRPSKVTWSQPLLPPLSTLSPDSAHLILRTICPNHTIDDFTEKLLNSIEGIPLAITLISNLLRDGESSRALWTRWLKEQTNLIENGGDGRESNLNVSITLSVHSPRTTKDPGTITLLAALSLLPDGFPLAEIEQLGECLVIDSIHKHLQILRAVALIKPDEAAISPRVQMLSPIRLFCLEFLQPNVSLVLGKTVDYYIGIMLNAENKWDHSELYSQIVPEIQNIHSIFQRAYKAGFSQDISSLIYATKFLTDWSRYIGYISKDTIQMALDQSIDLHIPHARCLVSFGNLCEADGHHSRAEKCYREAAEICKREKDTSNEAYALNCLGRVLTYMRQLEQAEVALKTSLELHTQADYKKGQADVGRSLGNLYIDKDQYSEAEAALTSALQAYKTISEAQGQANTATSLAYLHIHLGNLVDAENFATESLAAAKRANHATGEGNALYQLGVIYLWTDKITDARLVLEQALTISKRQNVIINQLINVNDLAQVYIQSDQLSTVEALLTEYARIELDVIQIPIILTTLGQLYICADQLDKAEFHLHHALMLFQKFQDRFWQAFVLSHLGAVYLKSNRLDDAGQVLNSIPALGAWVSVNIRRLWVLGELYTFKGKLEDAESSFNSAMVEAKYYQSSYQQGNIIRSLGTLHIKRGRINKAIRAFKRALDFHCKAQWVSEQATDLRRLGEAYEMLGSSDEAKTAFNEADVLFESVCEARTLKLISFDFPHTITI